MWTLVPPFIVEHLAQGQLSGQLDGVCLFADGSGFTRLTTILMAYGTEGLEWLVDILSAMFEPVINIIYQHGGFIAGFAGDAFKAIFATNQPQAYERVVTAAWHIQEHMATHYHYETAVGTFTFRFTVCVADGPVSWTTWQGHNNKAANFFTGAGLDQAMALDSYAQAGDVLLTTHVYQQLSAAAIQTQSEPTHHRLINLSPTSQLPVYPIKQTQIDMATASTFYPHALWQQKRQGEFRQVLTLFLNLQSLPANSSFPHTFFQQLEQYGGFLCRIGSVGAKDEGYIALIFWGATVSYENNVSRALNFVLDVAEACPSPIRAGLSFGMAYAGFVGSPLRAEYTCYSARVIQAVRQMKVADWGEIWLDEAIAKQAETRFILQHKDNILFKGYKEKQPVFTLAGRRETAVNTIYTHPLVGRDSELQTAKTALAPLFNGTFAGILTITGEAGIGKSHFVHQLVQTLPQPILYLFCQADEIQRHSLNPFRYALRHYFQQSIQASDQVNKDNFQKRFEALKQRPLDERLQQDLAQSHTFLGALVGLHWPDSLYESLEPELRFQNTLQAIKTWIKVESTQQPVIVHLEDVHWLDEDSRSFLSHLTRNVATYPFALVLTARPSAPPLAISESITHTVISLNHISTAA